MPQNIKIGEMLGKDFKEYNYMVSTNWRIHLEDSPEFRQLLDDQSDGHPSVIQQLSFACHSDFQFEASIEYAEAEIKGIHISQAAWQDRYIESLPLDVYENMDHRVFKALMAAANKTAGYFNHRNINEKSAYTFSGIRLEALGNSTTDGEVAPTLIYYLEGVQIVTVQSPNYTSTDAEIGSVQLELKAHGWTHSGETT